MTTNCWYRYDEEFIPVTRLAGMSSISTSDPNWYLDSKAMDHITGELEKLTMHETYHSNVGMDITHVNKVVLPAPTQSLHLNNVLRVPNSHKQLVSIHQFNLDNNTFIELHPLFS
jgi:hypothetical protein